jgi:acetoacetate decarboxylase
MDLNDLNNCPMLRIVYRTDPDKIAALLPPGLEPGAEPNVHLNIYNVPILGEPEYGCVTKVDANYKGMQGQYSLGYAIDQEAAVFISQELNGQPKYPAEIKYYRIGNSVGAKVTHQGYTFVEFEGEVGDTIPNGPDEEANEWWIKVSRAVGGAEKSYDFPPHVVRVHSVSGTSLIEDVKGTVELRDSPWDPLTTLLPLREQVSARLVSTIHRSREISIAGQLDPEAFWPFADTISGSRFPGFHGGPKK